MEKILERNLENLRGKYIKLTLTTIEGQGTISNNCRKVILDGFNEYHRELLKVLEENNYDSQKEINTTRKDS